MKKTIFLLTFLLCLSVTNAQKKISLTMRDGTVLHGFGRITMNDKIKFKKAATDKKMTTYTYRKVKGVTLYKGTKEIQLEYKIVRSVVAKAKVKLLEEPVITGPVTLYEKHMEGWTRPTSTVSSVPYSVVYYHISKDGSNSVTDMRQQKPTPKDLNSSLPIFLRTVQMY